MKIKPYLGWIAASLTLVSLLLITTSGTGPTKNEIIPIKTTVQNCVVKIPDNVEFSGEAVPLDDFEVFERLDREMHVNTYFHSSTFQNLKLANRWFPVIETILKEHGIPDDFKYLAVAESGLKNKISPANAVGYWQFLKTTGIKYGLTINGTVDERYHFEKATVAACKYLNQAHKKFNSWTLAAASYNMGIAGLGNRLAVQKEANYYDLLLNSETSRYIFRILALKLILSNPSEYGFCFDDYDLYEPLIFKSVEVKKSIPDLVAFAKEHEISYKTLKYLNPWLRTKSLTVKESQSYVIKIPA